MLYFVENDNQYYTKKHEAKKRRLQLGGRLFVKTFFDGTKEVLPESDSEWILRGRKTKKDDSCEKP